MTITNRIGSHRLRAEVAAYWQRAIADGAIPDGSSKLVIQTGVRLGEARMANPLMPFITEIQAALAPDSQSDEHLLFITDACGVVLWLAGSPKLRRHVGMIRLFQGVHLHDSDGSENAIGTAIHNERATPGTGIKHLFKSLRRWILVADVVRDPFSGKVVATICITGPVRGSRSIALAAVRAGARFAEQLLAQSSQPVVPADCGQSAPDLQLLGPSQPSAFDVQLTSRRADILALLVTHPDGLAADELAYRLYGDNGKSTTIRAEIHRIRKQFPGLIVGHPYRLADGIKSDVGQVRALVAEGEAQAAVTAYSGELLPRSHALEIELIRSELRQAVRAVAIASGGSALESWCASSNGWDDLAAIGRLISELPPDHIDRELLMARRNRLIRKSG